MSFLQELLPFIGLAGRLRLEWISSAEANKFVKVVTEFTEQIRNLGPNPLGKGYGRSLETLELTPMLSGATGFACACGHPKAEAQAC